MFVSHNSGDDVNSILILYTQRNHGSSSAPGKATHQHGSASLHNNTADQCIIYITFKNQSSYTVIHQGLLANSGAARSSVWSKPSVTRCCKLGHKKTQLLRSFFFRGSIKRLHSSFQLRYLSLSLVQEKTTQKFNSCCGDERHFKLSPKNDL